MKLQKQIESVFNNLQNEDYSEERALDYALYLEANTFLHGLLVIEDKLSMAFGLETRVPFLDNELVDFALKIPSEYKLCVGSIGKRIDENATGNKFNNYSNLYGEGKYIFRSAMNQYLPKEIVRGKKQGFSAPDASWFRGESLQYIYSIVNDKNARIYEYMDQKQVISAVEEHMAQKKNNRLLIWSILNFEIWLEQFL